MKFFVRNYLDVFLKFDHLDLAKIIIEEAENIFRKHPVICAHVKATENVLSLTVLFENRDKIIDALAAALKIKFPYPLLEKYQDLNNLDKSNIYNKITFYYYKLVIESTENLSNLNYKMKSSELDGKNMLAEIPLAPAFKDPDTLSILLSNCMGEVISQLHDKNELINFRNSL